MKKAVLLLAVLVAASTLAAAQVQVTEKQAREALLKAGQDVAEMAEMGLGITHVNDTLNEARKAFEGTNYTKLLGEAEGIEDNATRQYTIATLIEAQRLAGGGEVSGKNYALTVQKAGEVARLKERAYLLSDSLRALELRIEEMRSRDLETGEADALFKKAQTAFKKESYGEAEDLVFQANAHLSETDAEATLVRVRYKSARENAVAYFNRYKEDLALAGAALLVLALILYSRVNRLLVERKLRDLRLEKGVLTALIKKAQIDHFSKGLITRDTYDIKVAKYKERTLEIERTIPVLETRLRGRTGKEEKGKEVEISPEDLSSVRVEAPPKKAKGAPEERRKGLERELKEKEAELRRVRGEKTGYEEVKRLEEETRVLRMTLEGKGKELERSKGEVDSLKAMTRELEERLKKTMKVPVEVAGAGGLKEELGRSRADLAEREREVEAGKRALEEAGGQIDKLQSRSKELEAEVEGLKKAQAAGEELKKAIEGKEERIKELEARLEEAVAKPEKRPPLAPEELQKQLKLAETEKEVVVSLLQKLAQRRGKVSEEEYRTREEHYRERLAELEETIKELKLGKAKRKRG